LPAQGGQAPLANLPGSLMQQSIWLTMSDAVVGEGAMK
jgi:hypothetical protein